MFKDLGYLQQVLWPRGKKLMWPSDITGRFYGKWNQFSQRLKRKDLRGFFFCKGPVLYQFSDLNFSSLSPVEPQDWLSQKFYVNLALCLQCPTETLGF